MITISMWANSVSYSKRFEMDDYSGGSSHTSPEKVGSVNGGA